MASVSTTSPGEDGPDRDPVEISLPITVEGFASQTSLKWFEVIGDLLENQRFLTRQERMTEEDVRHIARNRRLSIRILPP